VTSLLPIWYEYRRREYRRRLGQARQDAPPTTTPRRWSQVGRSSQAISISGHLFTSSR